MTSHEVFAARERTPLRSKRAHELDSVSFTVAIANKLNACARASLRKEKQQLVSSDRTEDYGVIDSEHKTRPL